MISNWQTKKLGEVLTIQNGYAFDSNKFSDNKGMPLVRIRDLKKGITTETKYIGDYDNRYLVHSGDFLIGMDGEFGCYEWKGKIALLNQRVCRLQNFNGLDPRFLFYGINKYLKEIEEVTSFTTVKHLSSRQIESIEFSYPESVAEQKCIVKILNKVLEKIEKVKENTEKNLQNSSEIFEIYLKNIFSNPHWDKKALGEIAVFKNGLNFTKASTGEVIKIVGVKNFKKSFFVPFENLESVTIDGKLNELDLLKEADIVTVRSNGNPELIGRTLLARDVIGKVSHSGFTIRIRLKSENIYSPYLCHYLKSQKARKNLVQSGIGVNIKSLNQVALSSLLIPIPKSLSKQKAIVKKLDELSEQTKKLEENYKKKLADLEELKKSVLQKAFAGEL